MTDPERFRRLEELFHLLVELPADERERRLAALRRDDPSLHDEVVRLLAHASSDSLEPSPLRVEVVASGAAERDSADGRASRDLPRRLGPPGEEAPYELLEVLGVGGMGTVYRARDLRLGREVAVKLLHGGDPGALERHLAEARAQARVDHPVVCKVFEAGMAGGMPYVAMQLVRGGRLSDVAPAMNLEERVAALRAVCDGVQAAHQQGLVHRDIKPSNILVERGEEGRYHPYLTDFGLAREAASQGRTATGSVLGTPAYMAPEQARGEVRTLDRRTDVYGLGATLYELLSGRPPFEGESSIEVLLKVLERDPAPLRRLAPSLPRDLEAIVAKCLEKEPERRYGSARALAEDLDRYVAGDPVAARPVTRAARWLRKARRHRLAVAAGAVLLLLAAGLATLFAVSRWTARERQRLTTLFLFEERTVEEILRYAYARPLHDVSQERELARQRLEALRQRIDEAGPLARGPGAAALGLGHLALGDLELARELLERAWSAGERRPEVAFALGRVHGGLYRSGVREVERIPAPEAREAALAELDARHRRPARAYLGQGAEVESAAPDQFRALLALLDRRWDEALAAAERASRAEPWLPEHHLLKAEILASLAREQIDLERMDRARELLARSREALQPALEQQASDPTARQRLCHLEGERLYSAENEPLEAMKIYPRAVEACEEALAARPDSAEAHAGLAYAHWQYAVHLLGGGEEARGVLERAVAAAERAQELAPDWEAAYNHAGIAHGYLARFHWRRGGDPRPHLELAVASFDRALALDPNYAFAHLTRGIGCADLGRRAEELGEDPGPWYDEAHASYGRASALAPHWLFPKLMSARLQERKVHIAVGSERDPAPEIAMGLEIADAIVRLNPETPTGPRLAALFHRLAGLAAARSGADPELHFARAEEALTAAASTGRDPFAVDHEFALLCLAWSDWTWRRGGDPADRIAAGLAAAERALAIRPTWPEVEAPRGALLRLAARRAPPGAARAELDSQATRVLSAAIAANARLADDYRVWLESAPAPGAPGGGAPTAPGPDGPG